MELDDVDEKIGVCLQSMYSLILEPRFTDIIKQYQPYEMDCSSKVPIFPIFDRLRDMRKGNFRLHRLSN